MDYVIKSIFLGKPFENYSCSSANSTPPNHLVKLSKINVFVGPNNSGKSRFLRRLAFTKQLESSVPQEVVRVAKLWEDFKRTVLAQTSNWGVGDFGSGFLARLRGMSADTSVKEGQAFMQTQLAYLNEMANKRDTSGGFVGNPVSQDQLARLNALAEKGAAEIQAVMTAVPEIIKYQKLYFPTLRGLRPLHGGTDSFAERTSRDYFGNVGGADEPPELFTGLQLYQELQALLLGNLQERKIVEQFQIFLSQRFFETRPIALIPKLNQDVLDIKIGDEREFPIYALGDGLQSLIILTFPLFKYQSKPLLAFFEEPEMFMHPGMQRGFLNTLNAFEKHQFFITTHSNHFLDITMDLPGVSIYTFTKQLESSERDEKQGRFTIENVSNDDSRSLEMLGVRNSSVFLSNCTVWVEGITDRRYFQHFLKLYQDQSGSKQFREDWHYSFVEYGGSNITHWSVLDTEQDAIDVKRLCGRLFLIADGDTATAWKEKRHEQLERNLGQNYCRLQVNEVENLLPPSILKCVLQTYGETEIQDVKQEEYTNAELGEFIETTMLYGKKQRPASYKRGSTLNDKVAFCAKALDAMKSFETLSPPAKDLTKRVYEFIAKNNQ
jgi:predicted ATPase